MATISSERNEASCLVVWEKTPSTLRTFKHWTPRSVKELNPHLLGTTGHSFRTKVLHLWSGNLWVSLKTFPKSTGQTIFRIKLRHSDFLILTLSCSFPETLWPVMISRLLQIIEHVLVHYYGLKFPQFYFLRWQKSLYIKPIYKNSSGSSIFKSLKGF